MPAQLSGIAPAVERTDWRELFFSDNGWSPLRLCTTQLQPRGDYISATCLSGAPATAAQPGDSPVLLALSGSEDLQVYSVSPRQLSRPPERGGGPRLLAAAPIPPHLLMHSLAWIPSCGDSPSSALLAAGDWAGAVHWFQYRFQYQADAADPDGRASRTATSSSSAAPADASSVGRALRPLGVTPSGRAQPLADLQLLPSGGSGSAGAAAGGVLAALGDATFAVAVPGGGLRNAVTLFDVTTRTRLASFVDPVSGRQDGRRAAGGAAGRGCAESGT